MTGTYAPSKYGVDGNPATSVGHRQLGICRLTESAMG